MFLVLGDHEMALLTQARVSNHLSACNAQADRRHDLDDDRRTPACADTADRHDEYRRTEGIPRFEYSSCPSCSSWCGRGIAPRSGAVERHQVPARAATKIEQGLILVRHDEIDDRPYISLGLGIVTVGIEGEILATKGVFVPGRHAMPCSFL